MSRASRDASSSDDWTERSDGVSDASTRSSRSSGGSSSSTSHPCWFDAHGEHEGLVRALNKCGVRVLWKLGALNSPSGNDPVVMPGVARAPGAPVDVPVIVKLVPPDKVPTVRREMQLRERLLDQGAAHAAVPLHSVVVHGDVVAVVMVRASSDLFHALDGVVGPGDSPRVVQWFKEVAQCLCAMHAVNVAHRDVKGENVLLMPQLAPGAPPGSGDAMIAAQHDWEDTSMFPDDAPLALRVFAGGGDTGRAVVYTAALCDFEFATVRGASAAASSPGDMRASTTYGTDTYTAPEAYPKLLLQNRPVKYFDVWMPSTHRRVSKRVKGFVRHAPRSRARDVPEHAVAQRVLQERYDCAAADVWAFGVMVYVLCTDGAFPFKAACPSRARFTAFVRRYYPQHARAKSATHGCRPAWHDATAQEWVWPTCVPHGARHMLTLCWNPDPAARAGMRDVASHPWLHDPRWVPDTVHLYTAHMSHNVPSAHTASPSHDVPSASVPPKKRSGTRRGAGVCKKWHK